MKRKQKLYNCIRLVLAVVLGLLLIAGVVWGRYAAEWDLDFDLLFSPVGGSEEDPSVRRYFRSNELTPVSDGTAYEVQGTSTWLTVANALDSQTVSAMDIDYTLTYYASADGSAWTAFKTERGTLAADTYQVEKYAVAPHTVEGTVCNYIKVRAATSSFLQEDLEAVYTFVYTDHTAAFSYADGVVTLRLDTNSRGGDYRFAWGAGLVPDNADPNGLLTAAAAGPSEVILTLTEDTAYEFLFFVTDADLMNADAATAAVTVSPQ